MNCPACGADNASSRAFCLECGHKLVIICPSCNFENTPQAKFCGGCGNNLQESVAEAPSPGSIGKAQAPAPSGAASAPERRQITVMFCDIVGSTELSSRLDPEVLTELYQGYRAATEEVILSFEGYIAEYLGDGIVAYFGYPQAQENAAERSVRAALATIEALKTAQLSAPGEEEGLSVRIGIATGLVVAGDLLGATEEAQVRTVVGETPNLAARLQGLATPNSVVIGENTRALLGNLFALEALPPAELKGLPAPVTPYLVAGLAESSQAEDESGSDGPLVGRTRQLGIFDELWRDVREGRGSALLISGEPGIGKSRLTREFARRLESEDHIWLLLKSSPFHQNTAFFPVADLLRRVFDFGVQREDPDALERMAAGILTTGFEREEALPLLCELLSVPYQGEDRTSGLSAEARRRRTLELLSGWVRRLAENTPVVLLAEDLHWTDPSTLELLDALVEQSAGCATIVVGTSRPEFEHSWRQLHVTSIPLTPLRSDDIVALMKDLSGGASLPKNVLEQVAFRTDGVPLYVEELTRSVLESGLVRLEGDHFERTDPLPEQAIPATLQDSLMSRLDRLGSAKELAQRAAVIGRDFSFELIAALADRDSGELVQDLQRLVEAQLVFQQGLPPRATYSFKHALVQETAYQSLLKKRRADLHGRVAETIISEDPDRAEREPEVLARHFSEAERLEEAVQAFLRAAAAARSRSAQVEAVNHVKQGLTLIERITEGAARDSLELSLLITLQAPLISTSGYANPEVEEVCARARSLCETAAASPMLPYAVYGLTTFYLNSCNLPACQDACEQLLRLTDQPDYADHLIAAHLQLSFVNYFAGQLSTSLEHAEQAIAAYDIERHSRLTYGQDPGASAHAQASVVAWQLGEVDRAVELGKAGVALARQLNDPFTLAMTQSYLSYTHVHRQDRKAALALAESSIALCDEQNFPQWGNQARVIKGWSLADGSATTEEGLTMITTALGELAQVGMVVGGPYFMTMLVEAFINAGMYDGALATIDNALGLAAARGNHWMNANHLQLKAGLILEGHVESTEDPRALLNESVSHARSTGSRIHELRALCLLIRHGLAGAAEPERLNELLNGLSEGADTVDLIAARAVADAG